MVLPVRRTKVTAPETVNVRRRCCRRADRVARASSRQRRSAGWAENDLKHRFSHNSLCPRWLLFLSLSSPLCLPRSHTHVTAHNPVVYRVSSFYSYVLFYSLLHVITRDFFSFNDISGKLRGQRLAVRLLWGHVMLIFSS